ncbi:MAG: hypothetical protein KGN00_00245 [Chloroflexota bacterium]|nr:hypothetical protein [Chloroflexota bacterium]
MSDPELSPEEVREALPSTGDLMYLVGQSWWRCAHAARAGKWELAAYFARRVRGIQRRLGIVRPKYRDDLDRFESERIAPVLAALERCDLTGFERAFAEATDDANGKHAKWGKSYLHWVLPPDPPPDLDLSGGPGTGDAALGGDHDRGRTV